MHKRIFIGIPINSENISIIDNFREKQLLDIPLRWVTDANLHVTLHFIGNKSISELDIIRGKLAKFSMKFQTFYLNFERFELAPMYNSYMIWARFCANEVFTFLSQSLAKELGSKKDFKSLPHITLARFNPNKYNVSIRNSTALAKISVNEFYLYESILLPTGAKYIVLDRFTLQKRFIP